MDASTEQLPYRVEVTARAAELADRYAGLGDGEETDDVVTVAGRAMLIRDQGKLAFVTLREGSGDDIQLFCLARTTDRFDGLSHLNLGDWISATGPVVRTKRGELSVKVTRWQRLAEARRDFGDKYRGIADADLRYRRRYADLWANPATRDTFLKRSRILSLTRRWLEEQGYLEVETPVLQHTASGGHAEPFETHHNALDADLSLRIALELPLKRLVVGGFERVFEIGRVFRNEGISTRHNPEFTMLELYAAYADYHDMMELTEELVSHLAEEVCGSTTVAFGDRELDLSVPWRRAPMLDLIAEHTGHEISLDTPIGELTTLATAHEVPVDDSWGPGTLVLEIYEKTVEPNLWDPTFVLDYPEEVSPLARPHREEKGLVERFEAIVAGRELANAFSELTDPDEQRERFRRQAEVRAAGNSEAMQHDEDYIRALEYGLPPTGGLGIGMDRLVMLLTGTTSIRDVVLFPTLRPESGS